MFTLEVPQDETTGARAPVSRPDHDDHRALLRSQRILIETESFADPPDGYTVVEGDVYACDDCGALFASQQARAGHSGSHSDE